MFSPKTSVTVYSPIGKPLIVRALSTETVNGVVGAVAANVYGVSMLCRYNVSVSLTFSATVTGNFFSLSMFSGAVTLLIFSLPTFRVFVTLISFVPVADNSTLPPSGSYVVVKLPFASSTTVNVAPAGRLLKVTDAVTFPLVSSFAGVSVNFPSAKVTPCS